MSGTWMDRQVYRAFQKIHLKKDGRTITYRRGDQQKRLRVLVDDVNEGVVEAHGIAAASLMKTFAIPAVKFLVDRPQEGDEIIHEGYVWDVVKGANDRYYDYEDISQRILTVVAQRIRKAI